MPSKKEKRCKLQQRFLLFINIQAQLFIPLTAPAFLSLPFRPAASFRSPAEAALPSPSFQPRLWLPFASLLQ